MRGKIVLLCGLLAIVSLAGCLEFDGGDGDAVENQKPNAVLESSQEEAWTGESIEFDASRSDDPDGEIERYHFDFGDGSTTELDAQSSSDEEEGKIDHAYLKGGIYKVTVTVFDDGGERAGTLTDSADTEVAINQNYTVPPQTVFAAPSGAPQEIMNLSAEYNQQFEVYEAADRIKLNLTFEGLEGIGGSRMHVELLSPGDNVLAEENVEMGSGERKELDLEHTPVTEQGSYTLRVTAEDGGARYSGDIDVYYGEGLGAEEEEEGV